MSDDKEVKDIEEKGNDRRGDARQRERSCCYVVDSCGCYVDPCCCTPVRYTCCC